MMCDRCAAGGLKCASGACDCPCHGDTALREGRPMRVVISGTRKAKYHHGPIISREICALPRGTIIAHGYANGVDCIADGIAHARGYPVERWPVDWDAARLILGDRWRLAGPIRNGWMIHAAPTDLAICLPLPGSKGTMDTIRQAKAAGVPVRVVRLHP